MSKIKDSGKKKPGFLKFLKIAGLSFAALVVLFVITLVIIFSITDPGKLVRSALKDIEKKFNRQIEIKTIDVSLLKGISFEGIRVSGRGGFKKKGTSLKCKSGNIVYNPISLLNGKLDILRINFSGLDMRFKEIPRLFDDFKKFTSETNDSSSLLKVSIGSISLNDSFVHFNGIPLKVSATFTPANSLVKSGITLKVESNPIQLSYSGTLGNGVLRVPFINVDKVSGQKLGVRFQDGKFSVKMKNNDFFFNGERFLVTYDKYKISPYSSFSGKVDVKRSIVSANDIKLAINAARFRIKSLTYSIPRSSANVKVDNIKGKVSDFFDGIDGNIGGDLHIKLRKKVYVSGKLNIARLSVSAVQDGTIDLAIKDNHAFGRGTVKTAGGKLTLALTVANIFKIEPQVVVKAGSFDLYGFIIDFQRKAKEDSKKSKSDGLEAIPSTDFSINAKSVSLNKIIVSSLALIGTIKSGKITFDGKGSFFGGYGNASGTFYQNIVRGKLKLSGVNLRKFSPAILKKTQKIYGYAEIRSSFVYNLMIPILSSGNVELDISGGEVRNFVLQEKISTLLHSIPLDDILFDKIRFRASLQTGMITINQLELDSYNIMLSAKGRLGLIRNKMAIIASLSFSKEYIDGLPNPAFLYTGGFIKNSRVRFNLGINGSLKNPIIKINK